MTWAAAEPQPQRVSQLAVHAREASAARARVARHARRVHLTARHRTVRVREVAEAVRCEAGGESAGRAFRSLLRHHLGLDGPTSLPPPVVQCHGWRRRRHRAGHGRVLGARAGRRARGARHWHLPAAAAAGAGLGRQRQPVAVAARGVLLMVGVGEGQAPERWRRSAAAWTSAAQMHACVHGHRHAHNMHAVAYMHMLLQARCMHACMRASAYACMRWYTCVLHA
eukprot:358531-Chlamydomonas_euryale.AAC.3